MNVYDSDRMQDILRPVGYRPVERAEDADIVILNTCHIRERASEKVFSELGRLRKIRDARMAEGGSRTLIAVAGCVAQAEGKEIVERAPFVDLVLGPQTYHRLPEMIARISRAGGTCIDTDFPIETKFDFLEQTDTSDKTTSVTAFLTIQEGCDKFCSFCVVPYTRGAEMSRSVSSIVNEARQLVETGAREITLLGQNVNAYHGIDLQGEASSLASLIRTLSTIKNLERIRYMTSHPREVGVDLIRAHDEVDALMPFLHLPVQSGSDRILRAMNRGHTAQHFLDIVTRLRQARPDIALSSDFIVGFPGETNADFEATMQLIRDVGFAQAYSFKYSPRPGTPAATLDDQVDERVKDTRLYALQELLRQQQRAFNEASIDKIFPVLFTGEGRKLGQLSGRSPYLQAIHVEAPRNLIGATALVRITEILTNSLGGTLIEERVCA